MGNDAATIERGRRPTDADTDEDALPGLGIYFRDASRVGRLTADEELALARARDAGDADARDRLVRANLRLVVRIARSYRGSGLALEDLISEGNRGLIRAAEKFDAAFGRRFSTYASHWIKQAITRGVQATASAIAVPHHVHDMMRLPDGRRAALPASARARIASAEAARRVSGFGARPGEIGDDDPDVLAGTTDPGEPVPEAAARREEAARLREALARLTPRHRRFFELRYDEGKTFREIGRALEVSTQRAAQVEALAFAELRAAMGVGA